MQKKRITRVEFPSKSPHSEQTPPKKRVAAYARVSTMKDAQENSLQSQQEYFTDYIGRHPDWVFAGMYTDDDISGLSIRRRDGFTRMVADALEGEIQIDEAGARIVRFIYLLALAGKSSTDICHILMDFGIPAPEGNIQWGAATIRSILKNEKYMGDAILQKRITVNFITKTTKINEGEVPQYYVENGHPAIISRPVWQEVQTTWTDEGRRNPTFSPYANLIICGDCGSRYGRKTWHSTTYCDSVWECNEKKAGRTKCKCRHIYAGELDTAVHRSICHLLKTHNHIFTDCADLLAQGNTAL